MKKVAQNPAVLATVATRDSDKTLAKNYSSYTVNLAWLQSSTREPWWLQYLKSLLLEIRLICDNLAGFSKLGSHIVFSFIRCHNEISCLTFELYYIQLVAI